MQSSKLSVVYCEGKVGSQIEENKRTYESFGCFSSQVPADRADASDFHVGRTADHLNVVVKSHVI